MAPTLADSNNNALIVNEKLSNGTKTVEKEEDSFLDAFAKLKDEDLIRGYTPEGTDKRCLELCQTYIGGSWMNAKSIDDINFKRITGGLTNQLYKVELKNTVLKVENTIFPDEEPTVVAIKLFQPKHMMNYHKDDDERLNDIIVLTILSETGMGPKVYGIFHDGFIQAYHEHEQFGIKQQQNPKLLREVANLMARVHHLNVPIRKDNGEWMLNEMERNIDFGFKNCSVEALAKELDLKLLKSIDLREEFNQLRQLTASLESPQVFCHCDFRSMNVLVTEPDQKILLVDLEYSAYGARAYDMATFMMEWGQPRFDFKQMGIPENSALENFARLYIDGCERITPGYSRNPKNSMWTIVREIKIFILLQYMFFLSFLIKQQNSFIEALPFDPKTNMIHVEDCFKKYLKVKNQLISDGIIKK